jgi:hypothetical protein
MSFIWIIGMGRFGQHAVRYLSKKNRDARFVLVDQNAANLAPVQGPNIEIVHGDGVVFLEHNLQTDGQPDWIVPALPIHLAAQWCFAKQTSTRFRPIALPDDIKTGLPNPMEGESGDIYITHADFRCPDHCVEPHDICTVTQKPRKANMFDLLDGMTCPAFQSLVIRTIQLGPGVGGYRPAMLFKLLKQVREARSNLLISTACRCHGVVTAWNLLDDQAPSNLNLY